LAGASDELVTILLAEMREHGGRDVASVLGHAGRLPVASAALVNGAAAHALDFDDVNLAMPGHPSVAILPALLALAEDRASSGADVLTAFVAGYELQCRIGRTIAPGHYDGLGFHATATVDSFAAAAACAHLLRLDETGGPGLHQPNRRGRVQPGFRPYPQAGLQPRASTRFAARRLVDRQQLVQIPRLLLHDPRRDRGGSHTARTA